MLTDLHSLSPEELGKLFPIIVVEYNSEWPAIFEQEKKRLQNLLGDLAIRIEHFGSTAVPGLAAKPTIDILIEIPKGKTAEKQIITSMQEADYHYIPRTDSPPPYPMFVKGYTPEGFKGQAFHIHMAPGDHSGLWDRIYFRDYLINHSETAREYERLKQELAVKHKYNREDYTEAKAAFVKAMTTKAKAAFT